ncbi:MAG: histidine--tRNA ligase [Tissierella sp.]|uniref:histidine--tRNA ligase n=1 Tax=Tissierella sp. TaxID=41274 RepID=UPI003F9B3069
MSKKIIKPSILPGFMELVPKEQILFNQMRDTIKNNYEKFGFLPIDTPIIEKSEVLLAKSAGETEKQVYRFEKGSTDMSLRFDLTVPLARYVAQHYSELEFPFKRYHIGKVYRGERNQKGRFREFYQCDIDIIGNGKIAVINDAEIPAVIYSTFKDLGFDSFTIKINNRRLLGGFFSSLDIEDATMVLRVIDKIEKIGIEKTKEELRLLEIKDEDVEKIIEFIKIKGSNDEIIEKLKQLNVENDKFKEGLEELETVVNYIKLFGVPEENFEVDLTIARGLDYYTGTVYETFLNDHKEIGSVCSGGRYDDLASFYTKQKLPGVGISIGLTRLFYLLREANIIEPKEYSLTKILIIPMKGYMDEGVKISNSLREMGINTQVYVEKGKMGKKFNYADKLDIPFTLVIGEEEVKEELYSLRDMKTGNQEKLTASEIADRVK